MLPIQNPRIRLVIDILKSIDIDGETMQFIIEELGMQDQMIKQLIATYPNTATEQVINYTKEFPINPIKRSINYPLTKFQDFKLSIIHNYIDYYTSNDVERNMMYENAYFYVADDYTNELDNLINQFYEREINSK